MAWIFIDMMTSDDANSATGSAGRIADPRLAAFHDPKHRLGRAMARVLGWQGHVAWDTYFVYRAGMVWQSAEMPLPVEWFHQLKDREVWEQTAEAELGTADWTHALPDTSEADPARFCTGTDLRHALERALTAAAQPDRIRASQSQS
jgi:hypothetical protein